MAETTINRIERGHHEARISTVRRLATALNVSPPKLAGLPAEDQIRAAA